MKCNVNRFKSVEERVAVGTKIIEETVETISIEEDVKHLLAIQTDNAEHTIILLSCLCFDKVNNQIDLRTIKDKIYSISGADMDLKAVQECLIVSLIGRATTFLVNYTDKQKVFDKNIKTVFLKYSYDAMRLLDKSGLNKCMEK